MATLQVDNLRFTFKPSIAARKYDDSRHFQESWRLQGGHKAVDVVAMRMQAAPAEVWLIEAKDFRTITNPPEPANLAGLAGTMDRKVKDTIAGLRDGAARASNPEEKAHAARAVAAKTTRVVLHLEPHVGHHSALFPRNFPASVLQKLRQLVRDIDLNPLVVNISNSKKARVPWTVS